MTQPSSDPLQQAESLLRSGDKDEARHVLVKLLETQPDSAKGWWLMSYAVRESDQQIECLERVLELHPNHRKAQARIAALSGKPRSGGLDFKGKLPTLSKPILALIVVLGCLGLMVIAYLGYQIITPEQVVMPTQMEIAQEPLPSATQAAGVISLPTNTSTAAPTITSTPPPAVTYTPLVSLTPTPDPNATSTPISENQVGRSIGQYPPDFTLTNAITNQEVNLRALNGQPVLLVFFNTLSAEADPLMPGLQAVYEKYQVQGLEILGIGVGSSQSALRTYTGRFGGLTFPLLSDWEHTIAETYEVDRLPTTFFIRRNGKIWQINTDLLSEAELDLVIASLFNMP